MNSKIVVTVKKELRDIIKDKKTTIWIGVLILMLLVSVFVSIYFINKGIEKEETKTKDDIVCHVGVNYKLTQPETEIIGSNFHLDYYKTKEELQEAYEKGKIDAYITLKDKEYTVYLDNTKEITPYISDRISGYFYNYNEKITKDYLTSINVNVDKIYNNFNVVYERLDDEKALKENILQEKADSISNIIILVVVYYIQAIVIFVAINSSIEIVTGEKEHGTLETMLTFPIKIRDFIMGKYLAMTIACCTVSVISILLIKILFSIANRLIKLPKDVFIHLGIGQMALAILLMFIYSLFISALCVVLASFAKTYKEAQNKVSLVMFILLVPFYLRELNISLNSKIVSIIPGVNYYCFLEKMFSKGLVFDDIINLILIVVSTIVYSVALIKMVSNVYKSEERLF